MARREIGEINAGSMADIAFLLLIFFLVTTTMEVDAGIGRQLPLKVDPDFEFPKIELNKRNVLEIMANSNDQLLVENQWVEIDDLYDIVMDFYTVNKQRNDVDVNMPNYSTVDIAKCNEEIGKLKIALEKDPKNVYFENELGKWEAKLDFCKSIPSGSYKEMNKQAIIQLKNQGGTSYGLYIEIQNILKQVVNELRVQACLDNDYPDYFELSENDPDHAEYIANLRILVPERIIESKIDR